jgi:cystathionine beta-lyase/cystathionine gamma-synthase
MLRRPASVNDATWKGNRLNEQDAFPLTWRTRAVHAGENRDGAARPLVTPIYQSSVFAAADAGISAARHEADQPNYSRDRFPNVRELEQAVAELEGAEAGCAASSGMAAISLVFLTFLSAGDHAVLAQGAYCDTENLFDQVLSRFGVQVTLVDATDPADVEQAMRPETRVLFVETIANPSMQVPDLDALSQITARHKVIMAVDNTFATPVFCRPLKHGADLVVHSATKFLGGHHDLTAGVVVGRQALVQRTWKTGYLIGAVPGAMDAWLTVRGIRTLASRMTWINETAREVARYLTEHRAVSEVRYPGLATGKDADVTGRILPDGSGGMLAFRVDGGDDAAKAFIRRLCLIAYAPSLGGTGTTICFPPRTLDALREPRHAEGWLRLSVGLESPADLMGDIEQAFDSHEGDGHTR